MESMNSSKESSKVEEPLSSIIEVFKDCSVRFVFLPRAYRKGKGTHGKSASDEMMFEYGRTTVSTFRYNKALSAIRIYYYPMLGEHFLSIPEAMFKNYPYLELCAELLKELESEFPYDRWG